MQHTRANGEEVKCMDKGRLPSMMESIMKEHFTKELSMVKANTTIKIKAHIKAVGLITKDMDLVFIKQKLNVSRETGSKIFRKDLEL